MPHGKTEENLNGLQEVAFLVEILHKIGPLIKKYFPNEKRASYELGKIKDFAITKREEMIKIYEQTNNNSSNSDN